ncbi:MAG: ATP-binding cassette domain-containing protein [Phyllobacteriaceae bacterium]|nr:ATP-binding cassette domain-containing protein [Phyllobacteriaceae bacterium]
MLRADNLTFAYQASDRPYHFTLEALPGEVTAVSGASGAGKSTLLDLLAGFATPTSGTLTLDGEDLLGFPPETRPVSLLLQADNLFDHLTAAENASLGLPKRTPKDEVRQRVSAALAEVGLAGLEDRPSAQLSGGQKQRVALARTLLRERSILLLDEPFSALDDETRKTTRELVGELTRRHGWHTLLVSHHADDIAALASRHYRIVEGKLERV